jgi:hypothetical protein
MSITKILTDEKTSAEEKLAAVADVIAGARETYGNQDSVIEAPSVETTHGSMSFVHLEDDAKVALLRGEVMRVKAEAVEFATQNPGANLNRKIGELLSLHGMFVNIAAGTKFDYI